LADLLRPHLSKRDVITAGGPDVALVVKSLQQRAQTLEEMAERALFYFNAPTSYDGSALAKYDTEKMLAVYDAAVVKFTSVSTVDEFVVEALLKEISLELELKMGLVGQPIRIALSGSAQAPGLGEIVMALGLEETVRRIQKARAFVAG
jgi:glutamyl-tRNA synthetase